MENPIKIHQTSKIYPKASKIPLKIPLKISIDWFKGTINQENAIEIMGKSGWFPVKIFL